MSLDIDKYIKKNRKRNCTDFIKYKYLKFLRKSKIKVKSYFFMTFKILVSIILLLISLILILFIIDYYESNYKYSIAMPTITGRFDVYDNDIYINGLENIVNENIASLSISELHCSLDFNTCYENRVSVTGFGDDIYLFPFSNEYIIKYNDKNKILFNNHLKTTNCEIDLVMKTLFCTIKNTGFERKPRKIEVITDNNKILNLEKEIITKYLKKDFWK